MTAKEIRETLEKQLQLLSERSKDAEMAELPSLTGAMISTAETIFNHFETF